MFQRKKEFKMTIAKNTKDKKSMYNKYINDIIKSLENESGDWNINISTETLYIDESFDIIVNLEKKKIDIFERHLSGKIPKLITGFNGPFKLRREESKFLFNGLMISNISILGELICAYDKVDDFNSLYSIKWDNSEKIGFEVLSKLKLFLFDAIFSDRFYKENVKHWFGFQQNILFSNEVSIKSIFQTNKTFESCKRFFDKNIIEILGGELHFDN